MFSFIKHGLLFWLIATGGSGFTQQPKLMLPVGHLGEVEEAFSPDGKKVLTTASDGTAKLWDIYTGRMLADLVGHKGEVIIAKFTPDGQKIITAATDNTVKVWSSFTGELLHTLNANKGSILSLEFREAGNRLLIYYDANGKSATAIWSISSGKLLSVIEESMVFRADGAFYISTPVISVSPAGKYIARTGVYGLSRDSMIIVVKDVLSGKNDTAEGIFPNIHYIRFSGDGKTLLAISNRYRKDAVPDGSELLSKGVKKIIAQWDPATGKLLRKLEVDRPAGYDSEIKLSNDGKIAVIGMSYNKDGRYKTAMEVWSMLTGKILHHFGEQDGYLKFLFGPLDKTLLIMDDHTVNIRDLTSGKLLLASANVKGEKISCKLERNSKAIAITEGKTVKIWDVLTGKLLHSLQHPAEIEEVQFGADDKTFVTTTADNHVQLWDIVSGKLLRSLSCGNDNDMIMAVNQSRKGNYLAVLTEPLEEDTVKQTIGLWHWATGRLLWSYKPLHTVDSLQFGPDGESIAMYYNTQKFDEENNADNVQIRETQSGKMKLNFKGNASYVRAAVFSPDEKRIITSYKDSTVKIWEVSSGKFQSGLSGHIGIVNTVQYSKNGNYIITGSEDSTARIWDAFTGNPLTILPGHEGPVYSAAFSYDGEYIITASKQHARIWESRSGKLIRILKGGGGHDARFSPDGKFIVSNAIVWSTENGERIFELDWHNRPVLCNQFSPDGKYIVTASADRTAKVWSMTYGEVLYSLEAHRDEVIYATFSADGKKIITASLDNTVKTWDAQTGKPETSIDLGPNTEVKDILVKGDKLLSVRAGSETKIIELSTGEKLYSFLAVDAGGYLVVDKHNRYDGTAHARKLLYFVCNDEVIELEQVKDRLWAPNLAERVTKKDSIHAPTLSDLNICGLTPEVKERDNTKDVYRFMILPRRGGLGETALYVNGIEVKRYTKIQLKNNAGTYELVIQKQELSPYFIPGRENPVTVKAWISDNSISSRGLIVKEDKTKESPVPPNLYAVMVGVSDYKGDELDLQFAAKDAGDIAAALSAAARKLLNTDGQEHVFIYPLTTADARYRLPEKMAIRKTMEEIGKKAGANDILLLFFAGHGIMGGNDKKQFYFLTADASKFSATGALAEVGISTSELTEWMKPSSIQAQKRILIFDACNSGQAIRDFVQLGKPEQGYVAARSDERGQQIKAIEKLNNQSGLIILAASASNQEAYEMGRYSQGLLTYSLLKVMKLQPEILENGKYLDVTNWLNAAKNTVEQLAESTRARQEPQLNTNNNFIIGLIDDDIRSNIILATEKPLFAGSTFRNIDTRVDNLKLRSAVNQELQNISNIGLNGVVTYSGDYEGSDAYTLTGDYKISGENITVSVLLVQGTTQVKYNYEVKGTTADIKRLTEAIIAPAINWLKMNQ